MARPKIIVTGGTGYIGSHTVVDLVQNGFEPVLLDYWNRLVSMAIESCRSTPGNVTSVPM